MQASTIACAAAGRMGTRPAEYLRISHGRCSKLAPHTPGRLWHLVPSSPSGIDGMVLKKLALLHPAFEPFISFGRCEAQPARSTYVAKWYLTGSPYSPVHCSVGMTLPSSRTSTKPAFRYSSVHPCFWLYTAIVSDWVARHCGMRCLLLLGPKKLSRGKSASQSAGSSIMSWRISVVSSGGTLR